MASLVQLEYAVAVDRHRSFRKAAASCYVTQPTLSVQLQKLEEELEVVLFDRSRKPVAPTANGVALLDQFRNVLREYRRIEEVTQGLRGEVAGIYRLGVIPTMAPYVLPRLVTPFVSQYPEVELHIEETTTEDIMARLKDETLDGGILATPLSDPGIMESPICAEKFVVFHSPELEPKTDDQGRVKLKQFPMGQLMVMREGHCLRTQTLDLCSLGDESDATRGFVFQAGSMSTLVEMVKRGPYFTVLPSLAADELAARGDRKLIKELVPPVPYREIGFVAHRREVRKAVREALIDVAKKALRPTAGDELGKGELIPPLR